MTVAANFIFKAVHTFEKLTPRPSCPLNFQKNIHVNTHGKNRIIIS